MSRSTCTFIGHNGRHGSDVTKVLAGRKSSLLYDEIINAAATRTLWTLNADGTSTDFNHLMFANRQLVQKGFVAIMTLKRELGHLHNEA